MNLESLPIPISIPIHLTIHSSILSKNMFHSSFFHLKEKERRLILKTLEEKYQRKKSRLESFVFNPYTVSLSFLNKGKDLHPQNMQYECLNLASVSKRHANFKSIPPENSLTETTQQES